MIRRPPRSTLDRSSAASDVYKRQEIKTLTKEQMAGKTPIPDGKIFCVNPLNSQGATAVSYTHLRAHETVLDLVCRLLLEKKKKKINKASKIWTIDRDQAQQATSH